MSIFQISRSPTNAKKLNNETDSRIVTERKLKENEKSLDPAGEALLQIKEESQNMSPQPLNSGFMTPLYLGAKIPPGRRQS